MTQIVDEEVGIGAGVRIWNRQKLLHPRVGGGGLEQPRRVARLPRPQRQPGAVQAQIAKATGSKVGASAHRDEIARPGQRNIGPGARPHVTEP
jgi:hypothetical protein